MDAPGRRLSSSAPDFDRVGVVGAGTMGSGIALAALLAGLKVVLYDLEPPFLERARSYIETYLAKKQRLISLKYLTMTTSLEDLHSSGFVIEAAPEELALKQDLFARISQICPAPAILLTNTSTLPVTAIVSAAQDPQRAAGMHFFNPAPVLPLVEVVRGAQTSEATIQAVVELAKRLGKQPVTARDTPGFIVNRAARPFYGEALRLLGEGSASAETIDRIVRLGGGFRMGPFQLMDLIGIDVNFAATQSVFEQTFYEPRFRPHPIQAQMVQQKALGRKSGRGFYEYKDGEPPPSQTDNPRLCYPVGGSGEVAVQEGSFSPGLRQALEAGGYRVKTGGGSLDGVQAAFLSAGRSEDLPALVEELDAALPAHLTLFLQCVDVTLSEAACWARRPERMVGFDGLFFGTGRIATLVEHPALSPEHRVHAEQIANALGKEAAWTADTPALVLPRIVCALVNEAAFAAGEGVAPPETIDLAMRLGVNYPSGPLEWGKELGFGRVAAVMDHLCREYGEERYRTAPMLRRMARSEMLMERNKVR